jgi:hypothetical protein
MIRNIVLAGICMSATAVAQVVVPDGTKVRVRLDQTLSSATAEEGQTVELSVADAIQVDGNAVVAEGARASGTVVLAQEKRRMGRAGKLDFSVDRIRAVNGQWLPVRYTLTKKTGDSKAVSTGVITAGVAIVFWPAAPFVLLRKGKDTTINKGVTFDVFVDGNHTVGAAVPPVQVTQAPSVRPVAAVAPVPAPAAATTNEMASVTVNSNEAGADIEINGNFVGSTPTTVKLAPGQYAITVRKGAMVWQRNLQVAPGAINLNATFENTVTPVAQRRKASQ